MRLAVRSYNAIGTIRRLCPSSIFPSHLPLTPTSPFSALYLAVARSVCLSFLCLSLSLCAVSKNARHDLKNETNTKIPRQYKFPRQRMRLSHAKPVLRRLGTETESRDHTTLKVWVEDNSIVL